MKSHGSRAIKLLIITLGGLPGNGLASSVKEGSKLVHLCRSGKHILMALIMNLFQQ